MNRGLCSDLSLRSRERFGRGPQMVQLAKFKFGIEFGTVEGGGEQDEIGTQRNSLAFRAAHTSTERKGAAKQHSIRVPPELTDSRSEKRWQIRDEVGRRGARFKNLQRCGDLRVLSEISGWVQVGA